MRKFLILSAFCAAAHAGNFAQTDNQSGGKIVIMTETCSKDASMSRAYNYTSDGRTEDGCWKYDNDTVVIQWDVIGRRRYPIKYFSLMNEYREFKAF